MHKEARAAIQQATMMHQQDIAKDRNFLTSGLRNAPQRKDQLPKSMGGGVNAATWLKIDFLRLNTW